eukprot:sb/3469504/
MFLLFLFFLNLLDTASTQNGQLLPITSATAKTVHSNYPPKNAFDGNTNSFYYTAFNPPGPEWLKLKLEEPAFVSRVVIVNWLISNVMVIRRLLGTHVKLYDADGTTQIADCGKITEVNTANLLDLTSQTYTLPCDSSQLASYVELVDRESAEGESYPVMSIAEVMLYGARWKPGPSPSIRSGVAHASLVSTEVSELSLSCMADSVVPAELTAAEASSWLLRGRGHHGY